jgi:hypothetical protein
MNRKQISLAVALIGALLLPLTPATAATVSISPTSEITFDNQSAQSMRFDALGRAWIWNTATNGEIRPRLAIFRREPGTWERVQTVKAKKLIVKTLRFDSDGKAYATNFLKNEIVTWRVADSGTVPKERRVALRGRSNPLDAFPNADGSLFVLYMDRIVEFDLPIRRKERPVRTIYSESPFYSKLVALADGTVFVMTLANNAPIEVFDASQLGVAEPARTILIDGALTSYQYATDIALTPDGKVAVVYWFGGIAIFSTSASGSSLTPDTWYPLEAPLVNPQGVDFMSNGVMGVADYVGDTAVKVYFEN